AVHLVVDALAALVELALDAEGGELVGHNADAPAGLVGLGVAVAIGEDLVRRVLLLSRAKGAQAAAGNEDLALGRHGAFRAFGGDDDPATHDRILAQLRHWQSLTSIHGEPSGVSRRFMSGVNRRLTPLGSPENQTSHMTRSKSALGRARAMTP